MTERIKLKDYRGGLFAGGKRGPQAIEPKEQTISKSIRSFLDARRIYNDRLNAGQVQVLKQFKNKDGSIKTFNTWLKLCKKGTPDLYFLMAGRIYFVECKMRGKKPTEDQLERHAELRRAGAVIIVADSIDSFIEQFNELFSLAT